MLKWLIQRLEVLLVNNQIKLEQIEQVYISLCIQTTHVQQLLDDEFQAKYPDLAQLLKMSVKMLKATNFSPFNVVLEDESYKIVAKSGKKKKKNKRVYYRKWDLETFDVPQLSEDVSVIIGLYLVDLHHYFDLLRKYKKEEIAI